MFTLKKGWLVINLNGVLPQKVVTPFKRLLIEMKGLQASIRKYKIPLEKGYLKLEILA